MTLLSANPRPRGMLSGRRARLVLLLVVATAAISILAFKAAGSSLSYYFTPAEYLANASLEGTRVRVAGRVVDGSIVEQAGRPVAFDIYGDAGDRVSVTFEQGVVPNMFGPYALVVVEGTGVPGGVDADQIVIKHENEFFADQPPTDSISSHFVPDGSTSDSGK